MYLNNLIGGCVSKREPELCWQIWRESETDGSQKVKIFRFIQEGNLSGYGVILNSTIHL